MVAIAETNSVARRHPRVPMSDPVFLQIPGWSSLAATGRDLSEGGMALQLPHVVARGDRMIFDVEASDGSRFELVGEVCYVRDGDGGEYVAGLRWLNADVRVRSMVEERTDESALTD